MAVPWHCHNDIEFIFVIKNEAVITLLDYETKLSADGIILVNSGFLHELRGTSPFMFLSFKIRIGMLAPELCKGLHFRCDSTSTPNDRRFYLIKHSIAELVKLFTGDNKLTSFFGYSIAYLFLNDLAMHFSDTKNEPSRKHMERFSQIAEFIEKNYSKSLTLNDIAEAVGLQPQYISLIFKRHFKINFLAYYNDVRLSRAAAELEATSKTIEQISSDCGYSESRTFAANFKKKHGMSPTAYRALAIKEKEAPEGRREDYLNLLAKYLIPRSGQLAESGLSTSVKLLHVDVDLQSPGHELKEPCIALTVESIKHALYAETQEMLRAAKADFRFDQVILPASMEDLSYQVLAKALGFVSSLGLEAVLSAKDEASKDEIEEHLSRLGLQASVCVGFQVKDSKNGRLFILKNPGDGSRDMANDTCYMACKVVKRMMEGIQYPQFKLADDPQLSGSPFVGDCGLYASGGIKKPVLQAFKMLGRFGGVELAKGEGDGGDCYSISKADKTTYVILCNYEHLGELYLSSNEADETFFARMAQVDNLSWVKATILLKGGKKSSVREHVLNRNHGSSFDEWIRMGKPPCSDRDIGLLKTVCEPSVSTYVLEPSDGALIYEAMMEPLELRVAEITEI
jgi:AraC-like DNA-binding protein